MEISREFWRVCSSCKKKMNYRSKFYECSVSTCTRKRTGYVFCSVPCWERHLPGAKHRDAAAVEMTSPSFEEYQREVSEHSTESEAPNQTAPVRRIISNSPMSSLGLASMTSQSTMDHEVLVVVSKMKQYIKDKSDMNTAGEVSESLSDIIRHACDKAIENAKKDGRKTVMSRDFIS